MPFDLARSCLQFSLSLMVDVQWSCLQFSLWHGRCAVVVSLFVSFFRSHSKNVLSSFDVPSYYLSQLQKLVLTRPHVIFVAPSSGFVASGRVSSRLVAPCRLWRALWRLDSPLTRLARHCHVKIYLSSNFFKMSRASRGMISPGFPAGCP